MDNGGSGLYKKISADFKYDATKIFGGLKTILSDTTSRTQQEIANCVANLTKRLESVCEGSSVKPSASVERTGAAAAGMKPSTSLGLCSNRDPQ